jgi:hypothetical protein
MEAQKACACVDACFTVACVKIVRIKSIYFNLSFGFDFVFVLLPTPPLQLRSQLQSQPSLGRLHLRVRRPNPLRLSLVEVAERHGPRCCLQQRALHLLRHGSSSLRSSLAHNSRTLRPWLPEFFQTVPIYNERHRISTSPAPFDTAFLTATATEVRSRSQCFLHAQSFAPLPHLCRGGRASYVRKVGLPQHHKSSCHFSLSTITDDVMVSHPLNSPSASSPL